MSATDPRSEPGAYIRKGPQLARVIQRRPGPYGGVRIVAEDALTEDLVSMTTYELQSWELVRRAPTPAEREGLDQGAAA